MVTPNPLHDDTKPTTSGVFPNQTRLSDSRSDNDPNADANATLGHEEVPGLVSSPQISHPDVPDVLRPGPVNLTSTSSFAPGSSGAEDNNEATQNTVVKTALSVPGFDGQSSGPQSSLRPAESPATRQTITLGRTETNPFKRKDLPLRKSPDVSPGTFNLTPATPTEGFAGVDTALGPSNNPWQAISSDKDARPPGPPPFPTDLGPEPDRDPWQPEIHRQKHAEPPDVALPALQSFSPERPTPAWGDDNAPQPAETPAPDPSDPTGQTGNAWEDDLRQDWGKGKGTTPGSSSTAKVAETEDNHRGAFPTDSALEKLPEQASQEAGEQGPSLAPALPTRPTEDQQISRHSPRPVDSKSETYQIKNITWYDHTAKENPRTSPILVQNANGPCPLVALVNALTLTTPAELTDTVLVQVLRSREQISLGLLLDAVFDELMSPRRTNADASLPDVGDLYEFLKGLHTGMNVNPRFVPTRETVQAFERTAMTQLDPSERDDLIPGTFEDTVEMNFYAAFAIPLIHGWLPTKSDPLYQDIISMKSFFQTSATQLTPWGLDVITKAMKPGMVAILFRNDHFSTLYRHPHSHQLLALVTDAGYSSHAEIVWETLTDINGLNTEYLSGDFRVIGGAGQSDAAGHSTAWYDEQPSSSTGDQGGWTTVGPRGKAAHPSSSHPGLTDVTQEDHDLALALQLQEEEDERHRTEQARRHRERLLSEQYIEQQAIQMPPDRHGRGNQGGRRASGRSDGNSSLVTPRTSSSTVATQPVTAMAMPTGRRQSAQTPAQQVRPLVPPVIPQRGQPVNRTREDDEDAPPSYEQAQSSTPYMPPVGHPSHPSSLPGAVQSPNLDTGHNPPGPAPAIPLRPAARPGQGRPVPTGGTVHASGGRDRDCILM
ncbi:hypothetical protein ACRALDRAFT_2034446 [Sodiomyces alcalophilus JCM 7366]|uniref:uncharacterized protein n=1 Tax=Sodiomyces alcalophilus JCM 7366 TaxID=591952 RepID=UPI0039B62C8F